MTQVCAIMIENNIDATARLNEEIGYYGEVFAYWENREAMIRELGLSSTDADFAGPPRR
jgi:hypothetical protein